MASRSSRIWQDSLAHATIYEGDAGECAKWIGYAKQKLQFMLHNTAGPLTATFNPASDVSVRVDTRPNRIYIKAGEDAFILRFAADGHEVGWGKPYDSGLGTPGGYNPWSVVKTNKGGTEATIKKGLSVTYFDDNDEVTYSDTPNTGNCYWGLPGEEITWIGPYNQIGPVRIDMDNTYGGSLSDILAGAGFTTADPSGFVWVPPQFGKKVFRNKQVVAEFSNFVLGACTRVVAEIPYVIALTASSLHISAGLIYRIELFNTLTSVATTAMTIDLYSGRGPIPTHVAAFNLTGEECICAVLADSVYIAPGGYFKLLKINLTSTDAVTNTLTDLPLPEGAGDHKRLTSSAGFSNHTSMSINAILLGYGYDYATNAATLAHLITVSETYFGGSLAVSYLQVGDKAEVVSKAGSSLFTISAELKSQYLTEQADYIASAYASSEITGWYYTTDAGLHAFSPVVVYSNMQYGQLAVMYNLTNYPFSYSPPANLVSLERRTKVYTALSKENIKTVGISYDDKIPGSLSAPNNSWSLGNGGITDRVDTTSILGTWDGPFPALPVTNSTGGCAQVLFRSSASDMIPNDPVLPSGNVPPLFRPVDYYESRNYSYNRLFPNGVSLTGYAFGSYSVTGPFSWVFNYEGSIVMQPFPDLPNNFSAHLQIAAATVPAPSGYSEALNVADQLGLSGQTKPRIKASKLP